MTLGEGSPWPLKLRSNTTNARFPRVFKKASQQRQVARGCVGDGERVAIWNGTRARVFLEAGSSGNENSKLGSEKIAVSVYRCETNLRSSQHRAALLTSALELQRSTGVKG
jgi:hypothetical protein